MILCEKCAERVRYIPSCSGEGTCDKHGFAPFGYDNLEEICEQCAQEKGICQMCGCNLKTEDG